MYATNVKRDGGARDETEMYIDYSREELLAMLKRIENRCRRFAENDEKTAIMTQLPTSKNSRI